MNDDLKRNWVFYALCTIALVAIMAWKAAHPYTAYGCDGWGEYRRAR